MFVVTCLAVARGRQWCVIGLSLLSLPAEGWGGTCVLTGYLSVSGLEHKFEFVDFGFGKVPQQCLQSFYSDYRIHNGQLRAGSPATSAVLKHRGSVLSHCGLDMAVVHKST